MSGLTDYLTSDFIGHLKYFALDRTRDIVKVYVEGESDICFWESALNALGDSSKYRFDVVTYKLDNKSLEFDAPNGKYALVKMHEILGKNRIVCVDADWDLLIDGYSIYSDVLRHNKYIINTTYYSLENVLLSPEFHASLMHKLNMEEERTEYINLLNWISRLCKNIFFLMLTYVQKDSHGRVFWFNEFSKCINGICVNDLGREDRISHYMCKWNVLLGSNFSEQKELIEQKQKILTDKGYAVEDLWKFMRGHNLYASVVRPWIKRKVTCDIERKLTNYRKKNGNEDIKEYRKGLYAALGDFKSVEEAIDFSFYRNFSDPVWLPDEMRCKIISLYA